MFRKFACRATISIVAFLVGCAVSMIAKPVAEVRVLKSPAHQVSAITLKRWGCADKTLKCAVYVVTLRGDATATYLGYANDDLIGKFEGTYSQIDFANLVAQLEKQRFFEMPREFARNPDEETMQIEVVSTDGSQLVTTHNWSSMPMELRALEALIDYEAQLVDWEKVDD
jgi:hypothetical protein